MLRRRLTALALTAAWGLALAAPANAVTEPAAAPSPSRVGWSGWQGVHLGDSLTSAHAALGGRLYRIPDTSGGCGDVLTLRHGTLDGNVSPHPHRVSTITADQTVTFPLGLRADSSGPEAEAAVRASSYVLHTKTFQEYGSTTHQDWVGGPHGHTLAFTYSDADPDRIDRLGLSTTTHIARQHLGINGC